MRRATGEAQARVEIVTVAEVEAWLRNNGRHLFSLSNHVQAPPDQSGLWRELILATENNQLGPIYGDDKQGLGADRSDVFVPNAVYEEMQAALSDPGSAIRRLSSWPITRAFVYLDISDFSTMPSGVQLLVIQSLLKLSAEAEKGIGGQAEARLCIRDGYIYVWDSARGATWFAHSLAKQIENAVAAPSVPQFHFRMGVHIGDVRCFWDPGRNDWNYVGDGINGGNRVLSAIGKETDDVVFVSGQLRTELLRDNDSVSGGMVSRMLNRGRRLDKHKKPWRVYELNHST